MKETKSKKLNIRTSEKEYNVITATAESCGMTTSDYVRTLVLNNDKVIFLSEGAEIARLLINLQNKINEIKLSGKFDNKYALLILQSIDEISELFNEVVEKLTDIHLDEEEGDE